MLPATFQCVKLLYFLWYLHGTDLIYLSDINNYIHFWYFQMKMTPSLWSTYPPLGFIEITSWCRKYSAIRWLETSEQVRYLNTVRTCAYHKFTVGFISLMKIIFKTLMFCVLVVTKSRLGVLKRQVQSLIAHQVTPRNFCCSARFSSL